MGIAFAPVDGDPAELMRICVENGHVHVLIPERGFFQVSGGG